MLSVKFKLTYLKYKENLYLFQEFKIQHLKVEIVHNVHFWNQNKNNWSKFATLQDFLKPNQHFCR